MDDDDDLAASLAYHSRQTLYKILGETGKIADEMKDTLYSETETDEFRDVLYTMREDEVAGWVRSLQLRGVPLPDALKDEVFLIIGERRFDHA